MSSEKQITLYLGKTKNPITFDIDEKGYFCRDDMKFMPYTGNSKDEKSDSEITGMSLIGIDVIEGYNPTVLVLPEWCVEIKRDSIPKEYKKTIENVFANGVKVVDGGAFLNCVSLVFCKMDNVEEIGDCAFEKCSRLKYIPYLGNIKRDKMGIYAFLDCKSIVGCYDKNGEAITNYVFIPKNISSLNYCFKRCTKLQSVIFEHREKTDCVLYLHETFNGCKKLSKVEGLENNNNVVVGDGSFKETGITSIKLTPENTSIDSVPVSMHDAFYSCENLTDVSIDAPIVYSKMFAHCNNLKNVTLGDRVREIYSQAFINTGIEFIDFKNVERVGFDSFESSLIKEYKGTPIFEEYCFSSTQIEKVIINNAIGGGCFSHCNNAKELILGPDINIDNIGDNSIPLICMSEESIRRIPINKVFYDHIIQYNGYANSTYETLAKFLPSYNGGLYYPGQDGNDYECLVAYYAEDGKDFIIHPDCKMRLYNCFEYLGNNKINDMTLDLDIQTLKPESIPDRLYSLQVKQLHIKTKSDSCKIDFNKMPYMSILSFDENIKKIEFKNHYREGLTIIFPRKMDCIKFDRKLPQGTYYLPESCGGIPGENLKFTPHASTNKQAKFVLSSNSSESMKVYDKFKKLLDKDVVCLIVKREKENDIRV